MVFRLLIYTVFLSVINPSVSQGQTARSEFIKRFEKGLVLDFVLADHFKNDSADIYFDGVRLFQNVKLNSSPSDGQTDASVEIRQDECGQYRAEIFRGDTIPIKSVRSIATIKIVLNGIPSEFLVDTRKGKYVWFIKERSSELTL